MDEKPISLSGESDNKFRNAAYMSLSHTSVPSPSNIQMNNSKMTCPVTSTGPYTVSVPMTLNTSLSSQPDCYMPYTFHGAQSGNAYLQQVETTSVPTKFMTSVPGSHAGVPSLLTNREYYSDPLMLDTTSYSEYCSRKVLTATLPYKKEPQMGPFRVRISNRVQPVVNSPVEFLCKQEIGVPRCNLQSRKFQDQTDRSQSLNKNQQPPSSHGRNVAHSFSSKKSRFTQSSGYSTGSSSGEDNSHFQTDRGLGKRSGPGSWRKRENTTKVDSSRTSRQLPPSKWRKWSTNSDSGFSSISSNSSVNDSEQSISSFLSHTPWTDKLTQPGFNPVPVPEPDSQPIPFEPVPPQVMMGMSAGYISPQTEKPDQMFSTLKPGLDALTRLKTINHNRMSHHSPKLSSKAPENKERRFKRTAEALQQSGLWEVASRTGKLMKQNQELQTELDTFKTDALNFLKSVLKNSQNRNFIKNVISKALVSPSMTKNSSLVSSVMSVALKLGVYGMSPGTEGDGPKPDVNMIIPKTEIATPQENVHMSLLADGTNHISPDVKVPLANDLIIPLLDDVAVARLAKDFDPVDLSVVMPSIAQRLDGCDDIPIDLTIAAGLELCSKVETDMGAIDEFIPAEIQPVQHIMEIT